MAEHPAAEIEDLYSYYSQMMGSATDYAVLRLDGAGSVRSWHAGAQQLTQYTAEEIIGRPISQFYTAEDAASGLAESDLDAATKAGRYQTEGWRVRKDGSQFWAAVVLTAVHDRDGASGYGMVTRTGI